MDFTNLDGGQTVLALIVICLAVVMIVNAIAGIFTRGRVDRDELADRIEAAVKDATVDLLNALESIESDTTRVAATLDRLDERHAEAVEIMRGNPEIRLRDV